MYKVAERRTQVLSPKLSISQKGLKSEPAVSRKCRNFGLSAFAWQ